MKAAIDNDVLYKGAWYGLLPELVAAIPSTLAETGALGAVRFVIGNKLKKQQKQHGDAATKALERLNAALDSLLVVEPTEEEQTLAAAFENLAQQEGVALDSGESILCAVTLCRALDRLATGDKRAISAIDALMPKHNELTGLTGKVVCLEQLVLRVLVADASRVRNAICAAKHADKSLATSLSCTNPEEQSDQWVTGLRSYIGSVRSSAPTLLADD